MHGAYMPEKVEQGDKHIVIMVATCGAYTWHYNICKAATVHIL